MMGKHETGLCQCGQLETITCVLKCSLYRIQRKWLVVKMEEQRVEVFSFSFCHDGHHFVISGTVFKFLRNIGKCSI